MDLAFTNSSVLLSSYHASAVDLHKYCLFFCFFVFVFVFVLFCFVFSLSNACRNVIKGYFRELGMDF